MCMSSPCISQLPCSVMTYLVNKTKLYIQIPMSVFCVCYCSGMYFQTKLFQEKEEIQFLDLIWKQQIVNYITFLPSNVFHQCIKCFFKIQGVFFCCNSNLPDSLVVFCVLQLICCSWRMLISKNRQSLLTTQSILSQMFR